MRPVSGIYLVTLRNEEPISVNANDPRIAARCIHVTRAHCKVGKARRLDVRRRNYDAVFGAHNVEFRVLARLDDIGRAERAILARLDAWRMRGRTGRRNEWLAGIAPAEVEAHVLAVLREHGFEWSADDATKETTPCSG